MLRPDDRARVVRLLQSDRDLQFNSKYNVKNESLKRLCEKRWLDDAVISGFIMNYLVQQIDKDSFFYHSFFMSQLLFTGKDGKGSPTYTYENVKNWSKKVKDGLLNRKKIYLSINHEQAHWITLRIDTVKREIALWDSAGMNRAQNYIYLHSTLKYLGDEYARARDRGEQDNDANEWLKSWTTIDLSDKCPHRENGYDCGIFHLLNLCVLVKDGEISKASYSQDSIDTKDVRKVIAHLLWKVSLKQPPL